MDIPTAIDRMWMSVGGRRMFVRRPAFTELKSRSIVRTAGSHTSGIELSMIVAAAIKSGKSSRIIAMSSGFMSMHRDSVFTLALGAQNDWAFPSVYKPAGMPVVDTSPR